MLCVGVGPTSFFFSYYCLSYSWYPHSRHCGYRGLSEYNVIIGCFHIFARTQIHTLCYYKLVSVRLAAQCALVKLNVNDTDMAQKVISLTPFLRHKTGRYWGIQRWRKSLNIAAGSHWFRLPCLLMRFILCLTYIC